MLRTIILLTTLIPLTMTTHAQDTKTLVAYFSATGTTEAVAKRIARLSQADFFAIQPAQPYTDADLDWTNKQSRTSVEMNNPDSRPALLATCPAMDRYDTLYIGYPIWWYVAPHIINTFIESHDLTDKVIIPFATSGSSPVGPTVEALREQYPHLDIRDGRLLNRANDATVKAWISEQ